MSNINRLDGISAVEDLTDAAAAVVEGGGNVNGNLQFDSFQSTKSFTVPPGKAVLFIANRNGNGSGNLGFFTVVLRNTGTGRTTSPRRTKEIGANGTQIAAWSGVRGGSYKVVMTAPEDGIRTSGIYTVGPRL